jgi:signal transduction histidine kinase
MAGLDAGNLNTRRRLIGRSHYANPQAEIKSLTHDLASPLTAIKLNLELLGAPHCHKAAVMTRIYRGIDHIEQIIAQELASNVSNPGLNGDINWSICAVINEVLALQGTALKSHGINVSKKYLANRTYDTVPQTIFFRIVNNLITNAIEALSSCPVQDKHLWVAVHEVDSKLIITIRDNGLGLPLKMRSKLFKQVVTTKKNGHGLGLFSSNRNVHTYFGGKLVYRDNELAKSGAVFEIVI